MTIYPKTFSLTTCPVHGILTVSLHLLGEKSNNRYGDDRTREKMNRILEFLQIFIGIAKEAFPKALFLVPSFFKKYLLLTC